MISKMTISISSLVLGVLLCMSNCNIVNSFAAFSPPQLQIPDFFGVATKKGMLTYTHLEGNGQIWQVSSSNQQVSVVIDPLASQLDFGIPWGYRANKLALSESATIDLICKAKPTHCLLTMGLDDHTHLPTLQKLRERMPELQYIVAPSCEKKLIDFGLNSNQITILEHNESCQLSSSNAIVKATEGALLGPPWQKRENGYLLQLNKDGGDDENGLSIYYEPHGDVVLNNINDLQADVMISPVTKQSLPAQVPAEGQFTLVYGGDRTLEIAETLGVKAIVPLGNGALDIEGPLAGLVSASGNVDDFEKIVDERNIGRDDTMRVEKASPGIPLNVSL